MAIITLVDKDTNHEFNAVQHVYNGLACDWIMENIPKGENFCVYEGVVCAKNEISRTKRMRYATDVTVAIVPAGDPLTWAAIIVSIVVSVAATLLTQVDTETTNTQAGSSNNDLSDRTNDIRVGQRIVDFVGEGLSIPDVMQPEYAYYNSDKNEVRIGAYCFGRKTIDVADLSNGDNLIADIEGQSAGIYRPFTSPNNSAPYEQIGDAINEPIVGVYQSINAIGQTLEAPDVIKTDLNDTGSVFSDTSAGYARITSSLLDPTDYPIGSVVSLEDVYVRTGTYDYTKLGISGSITVTGNTSGYLQLNISNSPEFLNGTYDIVDERLIDGVILPDTTVPAYPSISAPDTYEGDTYKITREKVNRLLFNVYCPSGLYKRSSGDKESVTVEFKAAYWRLNDDGDRVGSLQIATQSITDATDNTVGATIDIDLGSATYIEWYVYRSSFEDTEYNGTVVDAIKLKSVYGLFDVDKEHFGDITMVQTKRIRVEDVTAESNPEVSAFCTEMIYKYLGSGVFDTVLSKNTQAMQSLIRLALDPKVGRLTVDDLDLDLLIDSQEDNETYYNTTSVGKCSYSFDDTNTSAQEVLYLIANAASIIIWREGRVLKSWFERPQSVPEMIFTHRSKIAGEETWTRSFKTDYDGVEFTYIDEDTDSEETLTYPEDATDVKTITMDGFRGVDQATWRMMREYYKLMNQKITVEFTATAEGRFAKPSKLIGVVKGTRVGQTGGYVMNQSFLTVELSQEVEFTQGDDHYLVFKTRAGGTQTVSVTETGNPRFVLMDFAPEEELYYGNNALKTEFSFGNEARLTRQLMLPTEIDGSDKNTTKITAVNYDDIYYSFDSGTPVDRAYSDAYSNAYA